MAGLSAVRGAIDEVAPSLCVEFPPAFVDAVAHRVAELLEERVLAAAGDRWMDSQEAADYLGMGDKQAVYDLRRRGHLVPDGSIGSRPRYRKSSLDHYLEARACARGPR
jgi:Helix-turn-helix domain